MFNKIHNVIFLDFETTGLNINTLKVIDVALNTLYKRDPGYEDLINHNIRCPLYICNLTNITNSMIRQHGKTELEVVTNMYNYIKNIENKLNKNTEKIPIYIVAHNGIKFDFIIFRKLLENNGFSISANWKFLDTLSVSRKLKLTDGNSMRALCNHYKVINVSAHRAMSDVKSVSKIYMYLLDDLCKKTNYSQYPGCEKTLNKIIKTPNFPEYVLNWLNS